MRRDAKELKFHAHTLSLSNLSRQLRRHDQHGEAQAQAYAGVCINKCLGKDLFVGSDQSVRYPQARKKLRDMPIRRPYFLYWTTIVEVRRPNVVWSLSKPGSSRTHAHAPLYVDQIAIMAVILALYPMAPIALGKQVRVLYLKQHAPGSLFILF